MPAYFIANYSIRDAAEYGAYAEKAVGTLAAFDGKPLVVDSETVALEGTPAHQTVVLEFPDKAHARAWYDSEAYRALIPRRHAATTHALGMICDGFVPPGA